MNQILEVKNFKKKKKYKNFFKIQLYISLILIVLFTIQLACFYVDRIKSESVSYRLLNNFNIERLYSSYKTYTEIKLNENNNCFIIGTIEIPKLNIKYPILSQATDELLKISSCRFYGPYPNKIGNLCIAAHNYDDERFFSNLYKLDIGDTINIYDSNDLLVVYSIYDKFETSKSDTSCTNQNTNSKREITLVTCNNINKNRLIVKAKETK